MLARTHQASTRTELRFEFFVHLFLRVKSGCAVEIARTSAVLSNKLSFVASTATPFEQLDEERENAPLTPTHVHLSTLGLLSEGR